MKTSLLSILFLIFTYNLNAQVTDAESDLKKRPEDTIKGWKTGGVMSLAFAQTSLTNWASGGQNSLSINGLFSVFAQYKDGKNVWDNSLDMGYGLLGTGDGELEYKKTDDTFDFLSKYG